MSYLRPITPSILLFTSKTACGTNRNENKLPDFMNKMSAKNKIIILLIAWLLLSGLMLFYLFKILDNQNQQSLAAMDHDRQSLALLVAEDQSFKQAQSDLQKLSWDPFQPADFFSRD